MISSKNYAIWLIFECARGKMARKSLYLLNRSCWVTLEISTLRTSPRMEVPLGWTNHQTWFFPQSFKLTFNLGQNRSHDYIFANFIAKMWFSNSTRSRFFAEKTYSSISEFNCLDLTECNWWSHNSITWFDGKKYLHT